MLCMLRMLRMLRLPAALALLQIWVYLQPGGGAVAGPPVRPTLVNSAELHGATSCKARAPKWGLMRLKLLEARAKQAAPRPPPSLHAIERAGGVEDDALGGDGGEGDAQDGLARCSAGVRGSSTELYAVYTIAYLAGTAACTVKAAALQYLRWRW